MDLIIGVTGASGTIYAVKLLEALKKTESVTTHVIFSDYAWVNMEIETGYTKEDVLSLADHSYDNRDLAACISSGSYPADGVIILPCSMKTLSGIANGYADNLITRVCDVAVKERRRLVICPRETPLNTIHLKHMYELSQMGAVIAPPMPATFLPGKIQLARSPFSATSIAPRTVAATCPPLTRPKLVAVSK